MSTDWEVTKRLCVSVRVMQFATLGQEVDVDKATRFLHSWTSLEFFSRWVASLFARDPTRRRARRRAVTG